MSNEEPVQGTDIPYSPEQHMGKITASHFADVIDRTLKGERKAPGKAYLIRVAHERAGGKPREGFTSWQMKQGTAREGSARAMYEYLTNSTVTQVGLIDHPSIEWVGGSPDGLVEPGGGLEIKCPEIEQHDENLFSICVKGKLPDKYLAQIQGCMWITGRNWWSFASFNPDCAAHLEFCMIRVERDDEYIQMLEREVRLFDAEVREKVEQLLQLNGGPVAAPVKLLDLDYASEEMQRAATQIILSEANTSTLVNDDFSPESFCYTHSEMHNDTGLHFFTRRSDDRIEAVRASDEWVSENRLEE